MWRAFVYGNGVVGKEDRARQAADTFLALDGKFDQNVVIQVGAVHSNVVLVLTTMLTQSVFCVASGEERADGFPSARACVAAADGAAAQHQRHDGGTGSAGVHGAGR